MTAPASTTPSAGTALSAREKRKIILGVGNALEWYDWTAYSIFAAYFAGQFFRAEDPVTALLGTLAIFAAGFLMRPLAASSSAGSPTVSAGVRPCPYP